MKAFLEPFNSLVDVQSLREALKTKGKIYDITGCADKAHLVFGVGHDAKYKLLVTSDEMKAKEPFEKYRLFEDNILSISLTSEELLSQEIE